MLCQDYYIVSYVNISRCDQFDTASNLSGYSSIYTWKARYACVWMYTCTCTTHTHIHKNLLKLVTFSQRNMFKIDYTGNVASALILENILVHVSSVHRNWYIHLVRCEYQRNNTAHSIPKEKQYCTSYAIYKSLYSTISLC